MSDCFVMSFLLLLLLMFVVDIFYFDAVVVVVVGNALLYGKIVLPRVQDGVQGFFNAFQTNSRYKK